MISTLEVAFADVSAAGLRWSLGLPSRAALASIRVGAPDGPRLELRLLGASHQVLAHTGEALLLSETVACDLPDGVPLPETSQAGTYDLRSDVRRLDPDTFAAEVGTYDLRSDVRRLDPDTFAAEVADVTTAASGREDALVGHYPGVPHASTVLMADKVTARELAWRTWHAYPQTGELVTTRSRLSLTEVLG